VSQESDQLANLVAQAMSDIESNPEEDMAPLNVMSSALLGQGTDMEKVPLEQAAHLLRAREAAAAVRRDEISLEDYLERLIPIQETAENGLKLFAADVVRKETEKLPPEQQELVAEFEKQVHILKEGIDLMASYADTGLIDELDRGLELVEQAMLAVDAIQDRAAELAEIEKAEKAEAEAQAQSEKASEGEVS